MGNTIRQYLIDRNYNTVSDDTYSHIDEWLEWYQNEVQKFHHYKIYNGVITTKHERFRLGMAKKVCEDWANLLLNEKVAIKAGNYDAQLHKILIRNNFQVRANQLVELTFALGTGAFVEYKDANEDVVVDYIRADMIYPLSWDNGDITECAFGSNQVLDGKETIYLQIHRRGKISDEEQDEITEREDPEIYYIENVYIDAESGKEIELPDTIVPLVKTDSKEPLFQIMTPNICNNIDLDSPLGVSVFANSISQLEGGDLVYDSYINEYVLGRKRVIVPISMAKMQMEKDGVVAPKFDPNDTVYYMMPNDRQSDFKLTEVDMKIRAAEHELGIQRSLDILSLKVGMGTGRYRFENGAVKTATEVISDKSDLYENRQKHARVIESAVLAMIRAISFLDIGKTVDATIDFDDSIIEDSKAIIDKNITLVNGGLRSKLTAIMEIEKCSEAEAKKELARIAEEGQITGQDVDWTKQDDDDDGDSEENVDEPTGQSTGSGTD